MSRRFVVRGAIALSTLGIAHGLAPTSLHAATLQQIRRRGRLVVAIKDNLRPLGFRDASGALIGLEIDLARRLAEALFNDAGAVDLQPVRNAERIPRLLQGQVDLAIARLTVNASRARQVDFSPPYYQDGTALLTRDPAIAQLSDLRRQAIAVLQHSSTVPVLRSRFPQAMLVPAASYQAAHQLLQTNTVNAFAADASVLTGWVQGAPEYRLLPGFLSTESLAIALPKGLQHHDLRQLVIQTIFSAQQSGWLSERIRHWGLP